MSDDKRPDLHHSQPVRLAEILAAMTPEERAAIEQRRESERIQEGTRKGWIEMLAQALEKKLDQQMSLTRELVSALHEFKVSVVERPIERTTLLTLKAIQDEVEEMRGNSRLTESIKSALCDSRDFLHEIRDHMSASRDELTTIRELLQRALSNGHAH